MEQKFSGCICSQQAQLSLLPVQAADPAGRGENESGSLLPAAPGPGQASPPPGRWGLRAGKAKNLGRQCLPEKKDTGETKGKLFTAEGNQPWKKASPSPHHLAALAQALRLGIKSHKLSLHCRDGEFSCSPTLLPSSRVVFSLEQGKGRVPKAKDVGGEEQGRSAPLGRRGAREIPIPILLLAEGWEETQHSEISTEISLFPCRWDYETTEAEFKYLQRNPAPHRDEGNKG